MKVGRFFRPWGMGVLFLSLITLTSHGAGSRKIEIYVELSPAGSFVAKSGQIGGKIKRTKNGGIMAKKLVLDLKSLKTGIKLRNKHMSEKYFETKKYPRATLTKAVGKGGKFTAVLNVHGVSKKVTGKYKITKGHIMAEFKVKISSFKIEAPYYMGVGVEDEVKIKGTYPLSR